MSMIDVEAKRSENVFILTPKGSISAEDIKTVASTIDVYINEHDAIPRLVFRLSQLPHWKDFEAMTAHFQLVKDHHKIIPKVAIVSDSSLLALVRVLVDQFTGARIRRFPEEAFDDAVNWAAMEGDHPGSFVVLDDMPPDVIGLDARGLIGSTDYRLTLEPLVEEKLKQHEKLKMLLVAGPYFDGFSAGALWDDAKFGLTHLTTFSKLALVTDEDWLHHSIKLFGALMPTEVMVYPMKKLDEAKTWITT
jgi:hypothetical protein